MTYTFYYQTYYGEVNELPLKSFTVSGLYINEKDYENFFNRVIAYSNPSDYELRHVEVK